MSVFSVSESLSDSDTSKSFFFSVYLCLLQGHQGSHGLLGQTDFAVSCFVLLFVQVFDHPKKKLVETKYLLMLQFFLSSSS